jgi:hypothetical protein
VSVSVQQPGMAGGAVKRISTKCTFAIKLTPFVFLGFLAFFVALLLANGALKKAPAFLVVPCVMAILGLHYWKTSVRNLVDEVDDCGDYLLVKKRGEEDTVLLSNIAYVSFSTDRRGAQARITLTLDSPGKFGTEISFAPPAHIYLSSPRRCEIAEDLLARSAKARSGHAV